MQLTFWSSNSARLSCSSSASRLFSLSVASLNGPQSLKRYEKMVTCHNKVRLMSLPCVFHNADNIFHKYCGIFATVSCWRNRYPCHWKRVLYITYCKSHDLSSGHFVCAGHVTGQYNTHIKITTRLLKILNRGPESKALVMSAVSMS